jgi:hypothetical protein
MDLIKLEGIITAIESEAKMPNPSHANLARLTAMLARALIEAPQHPAEESTAESETAPVDEPEENTILEPEKTIEMKNAMKTHHEKTHKTKIHKK